MSAPRLTGLPLVTALSALALGCWLGSAGTTRAELSSTAVVRASVSAGTWSTPPEHHPTATPTDALSAAQRPPAADAPEQAQSSPPTHTRAPSVTPTREPSATPPSSATPTSAASPTPEEIMSASSTTSTAASSSSDPSETATAPAP